MKIVDSVINHSNHSRLAGATVIIAMQILTIMKMLKRDVQIVTMISNKSDNIKQDSNTYNFFESQLFGSNWEIFVSKESALMKIWDNSIKVGERISTRYLQPSSFIKPHLWFPVMAFA
jgi:predicted GTPase